MLMSVPMCYTNECSTLFSNYVKVNVHVKCVNIQKMKIKMILDLLFQAFVLRLENVLYLLKMSANTSHL